jgi:hypothetical protein
MTKKVKTILTILIVITAIVFLAFLADMIGSFKYANREVEDPMERRMSSFEYHLEHQAYSEVMSTYYAQRLDSFDAPAGIEDIYHVAEYAHAAFVSRVYAEKNDANRISSNAAKLDALRSELGAYQYTADEIDDMIRNAP